MTRLAVALALAIVLAFAFAAAPTAALAAAPRADLVDIEDEVMCTTCKIPLNIAESPQADDERQLIRTLIAQGRTKAEIKQAMVAQYGADVLALPDSGGVGITAYAIPLALGAIVIATLALLVPRWRRRPAAGIARTGPGEPGLSVADAKRLDDDLARY
jgi:cytochrome c-type biogenesis protein CcmH